MNRMMSLALASASLFAAAKASAQVTPQNFFVQSRGDLSYGGPTPVPYGVVNNTSNTVPVLPLAASSATSVTYNGTTLQQATSTSASITDAYSGFITFSDSGSATATGSEYGLFQLSNGYGYAFTASKSFTISGRFGLSSTSPSVGLSFNLYDNDAFKTVFRVDGNNSSGTFTSPVIAPSNYYLSIDLDPLLFGSRSTPGSTAASADATYFYSINEVSAAVPEPATWGMMLLGFGAMGFAMRRRAPVRTAVSYA